MLKEMVKMDIIGNKTPIQAIINSARLVIIFQIITRARQLNTLFYLAIEAAQTDVNNNYYTIRCD